MNAAAHGKIILTHGAAASLIGACAARHRSLAVEILIKVRVHRIYHSVSQNYITAHKVKWKGALRHVGRRGALWASMHVLYTHNRCIHTYICLTAPRSRLLV